MTKRYAWQTAPAHWSKLQPLAQKLRKAPTGAEAKLWQHIRKEQIRGVKFQRQHAIEHFIADFCCVTLSLIIEVSTNIRRRKIKSARNIWRG